MSLPAGALGVLLLSLLVVLACGDEDRAASGAVSLPEPPNKAELAKLKGDVIADGSSTVYPIVAAAAEEFLRYARHVRVSVGISGTGGGFKKFCSGDSAISNASRPISPSERQACASKGIEFIELPIAYDGIAVVVNPKNTWAACLTTAELRKVWGPDAQGRIDNWEEIRPGFPDKRLKLYGPATDSGTFDYFTDAINGKEKASRGDYLASEDDNVLVTGVRGDEGALGYFGYAYLAENLGKVQAVAIDNKGDGTCVEPSIETIKSGAYQPLSRPLFIYVNRAAARRPEVQGFVNYLLSKSYTPLIQEPEVGYIALQDAFYAAAQRRFNEGMTGTLFPNGAEVGATLDRYLQ